jgi:hypothetical protein
MQIVVVLAVLGASLGQPDDPPDQDIPAAEQEQQQEADTEYSPAGEQQAEPPEANPDSSPAYEQQAEQQQPDVDSAAAGEQPAETGSDDASAGLDMATGGRAANWPVMSNSLIRHFNSDLGRTNGPFTVVEARSRQPALILTVAVEGTYSPEQWSGIEERARAWMCWLDERTFTRGGGIFIVNLYGQGAVTRTVMITRCD